MLTAFYPLLGADMECRADTYKISGFEASYTVHEAMVYSKPTVNVSRCITVRKEG